MALTDNLIGYWKFDSNSNDSTDNNHDGTDTSITYASGHIDNAASFNGTSSKIVLVDASALKPTGSYSIFGWMKRTSSTNLQTLFQSYSWENPSGNGNSGISFGINIGGDNAHHLSNIHGISNGQVEGNGYANVKGTTIVDDDAWHWVGTIYDGSTIKIYIDNVQDASTNWTSGAVYLTDNYVRFGQNRQKDESNNPIENKWYGGIMDEWGFWGRALTSDERTTLFNSGAGLTYPFTVVDPNTPSLDSTDPSKAGWVQGVKLYS